MRSSAVWVNEFVEHRGEESASQLVGDLVQGPLEFFEQLRTQRGLTHPAGGLLEARDGGCDRIVHATR